MSISRRQCSDTGFSNWKRYKTTAGYPTNYCEYGTDTIYPGQYLCNFWKTLLSYEWQAIDTSVVHASQELTPDLRSPSCPNTNSSVNTNDKPMLRQEAIEVQVGRGAFGIDMEDRHNKSYPRAVNYCSQYSMELHQSSLIRSCSLSERIRRSLESSKGHILTQH